MRQIHRLFLILAMIGWLPLQALATAQDDVNAAMTSNANVKVFQKRTRWLRISEFFGFRPYNQTADVGVIIYPGAFVDPRAYAPLARYFADQGYPAAIITPPANFGFLAVSYADRAIKHWGGSVRRWVVAGHSLGGSAAASYVNHRADPSKVGALALLASYPTDMLGLKDDLSGKPYKVTSVYGTQDGLTKVSDINNSKSLLPADANYVEIVGGNHTQFYYTDTLQSGDNPASVSRDTQQAIIRQAIGWLLDQI